MGGGGQANRIRSPAKQEGSAGEGSCHFSLDTAARMGPGLSAASPAFTSTQRRVNARPASVGYNASVILMSHLCPPLTACPTLPAFSLYKPAFPFSWVESFWRAEEENVSFISNGRCAGESKGATNVFRLYREVLS